MGKRGQRSNQAKKPSHQSGPDPVLQAALAAGSGGLCRPMPPKQRGELNKLVGRLLQLCSNFASDAPSTPQGLMAEHKEVRATVEKVREMERTANLSRPIVGARRAHAEALREWLEKMGGQVSGIKVEDYRDEGLGLEATAALSCGDVVLRVPRKAVMSVDTARDSEIGRLVESDPMLQTMGNVSLSLHLMLEKTSPASFWEPYINSLPQSYTTVLYFTQAEMEELRGSPTLEDALRQYKYVARQYAYFYRKFENTMLKDYFTYDEYRWAVSTVMTRQNQVRRSISVLERLVLIILCSSTQVPSSQQEGKFVNALIPFWDLANHRPGGQISTDYDDEAGAIKCMANGTFAPGEEYTIYYGERGNQDLLVHNGFCVPDNPDDFLAVRLGVGKNDPTATAKTALLEALGVSPHGHFALRRRRQGRPDPLLMAFLRVICLKTDAEVKEWADSEGHPEKARELLRVEEEEEASSSLAELDSRAYRYLMTRCELLLKSYPTTLEEDVETRKEEAEKKLTQTQRFCLYLRIGEKEILHQTIRFCKDKLEA